ncbi:alpha/beta-Hydrolases superfamily protein [Rhynchospora pubera]|uniref:Alpha/beta-Hydrolases superfamily protein n=1 Tax=Rhynchospora pubera TaxID=906938 RepID=A0AAV8CUI7_9POAL|nr:alpha/beta-Hydrolases superfamily protein [Rhynchospora pubera]
MGGVTSNMAAKLAFFPPDPPTYGVSGPPEAAEGVVVPPQKVVLTGVPIGSEEVEARRVLTSRGNEIVVMYIRNKKAKVTFLHSHGNAADLGVMYGLFVALSNHLRVNLLAYDYSGYGRSSGKPSEENTYADIEAAYKCLVETYGVKPESIILFGQSVGTGPTLDLAARLTCVRAVILQSPLLSGLRVMYPVKHTLWFDIYKNVDKITRVRCPVLIIHGKKDDTIDCSHGKQLYELCQQKYEPLWIEDGNHCDLETYPEYLKHLENFVKAIEMMTPDFAKTEASTGTLELFEKARASSDRSDISRKVVSFDRRERGRMSTGYRERPRHSTDGRHRMRKSVDLCENSGDGVANKPRKSIDRFMIRAVGLCNVDCLTEDPSKLKYKN